MDGGTQAILESTQTLRSEADHRWRGDVIQWQFQLLSHLMTSGRRRPIPVSGTYMGHDSFIIAH